MIFDLLMFPLYVCAVYIFGVGVLRWRGKVISNSLDIFPPFFYFVAAQLTVGFAIVVWNFFYPVSSPIFIAILIAILGLGCFRLRREDRDTLVWALLFAVLLAPITAAMEAGADAGLYHIPHQLLMRDEKVIFGLANLHARFGSNSFVEYISAPLWIGQYFKLLSYNMSVFVITLMIFLLQMARSANPSIAVLGFLTILGLIINSNFDFEYTSTDTPTGVMFAMSFFYGLSLLLNKIIVTARQLSILFLMAFLCFACKVSGAVIFLWVAMVLAMLVTAKHIKFNDFFYASIIPSLLMVIWLIRGFVISGCLLFPMPESCIDVYWSAKQAAIDNGNSVTAWARHAAGGMYSLKSWDWFPNWWWPRYRFFCIYMALTAAGIGVVYYFLFNKKQVEKELLLRISGLIFLICSLTVWFYKSPTPRFGIGNFIILPAVTIFAVCGFRWMDKSRWDFIAQKFIKICSIFCGSANAARLQKLLLTTGAVSFIAIILVVCLTLKFNRQVLGSSNIRNIIHFSMLKAPHMNTIPDKNFGVRPSNEVGHEVCWLERYCSTDDHPPIGEKYGYKYFSMKESQ